MRRAVMMKQLRILLSTILFIMIFKLFIMKNSFQHAEEAPVIEQAVSVSLKLVEESAPVVNVAPAPPKSVEIVPVNVDSTTARLNEITQSCCRRVPDIPQECYEYCTFDKLNSQTIINLAIHSSKCQMSVTGVWNMMLCMSSSHDHTPCCKAKGVHQTDVGEVCLDFCTGKLQPEPMANMGYYGCLGEWEPIMQCYKNHIIKNQILKTAEEIPELESDNALV